MNLTCPDCNHVAALEPSQLNPDGSYFGRCPNCGRRLIKRALSVSPADSVDIKTKISSHEAADVFYADYENWRADIPKILQEMKNIMLPGVPAAGRDVIEGGLPEWPKWVKFLLLICLIHPQSITQRTFYLMALRGPVFLLKKHRIFLEKKLVYLEKYICNSPDFLRPLMEEDHKKVKNGLRLIAEAREKMTKKFPHFPLEHDELLPGMTLKIKLIRAATWLSIWPMALFIKFINEYLLPNYDLVMLLTIIPQTFLFTLEELNSLCPTPVESFLIFSLAFLYLPVFILQAYRYPGFCLTYESFSFTLKNGTSQNLIFIFIILSAGLFFCPEYLIGFIFYWRFYNPIMILYVITLFGLVSYLIGAVLFLLTRDRAGE